MSSDDRQSHRIARAFDVPPWLIDGTIPRPHFPRLRWLLRRLWPL